MESVEPSQDLIRNGSAEEVGKAVVNSTGGRQISNNETSHVPTDIQQKATKLTYEPSNAPLVSHFSSHAPNQSPLQASTLPTDPSQIKIQLRRQIEYYFSRENLNHDTYLVSQMDADQYVDIAIIASFNQVKRLTSDQSLIVEVLKDSPCVQVDETGQKVRPLHKRSVVILREIPEGTTQQEIEDIFTHDDCPSFVSCEYASGDCWYVNFETEEQAQDAFRYIRETLQTFKGKHIRARIKAKPTVPSTPTTRPEQQRIDGQAGLIGVSAASNVVDPLRSHAAPVSPHSQSTIRYPVQLPHFPLQSPTAATYPFPIASNHVSYLPCTFFPPPLIPWSPFHQDPNILPYEPYNFHMPNPQQRPPQNSGRANSDRRHHSIGSSNAPERNVESGPAVAQGSSSNVAAKSGSVSQSNYYGGNSRNHGDSSNYHKQHHGGGDKLPNRSRSFAGNQSMHDHHYNNSEIPPRHREAAHSYRGHKQRLSAAAAAHSNQIASAAQSHVTSGPPHRRSGNNNSRNNTANASTSSYNGAAITSVTNHLPHGHFNHRDHRANNSNLSSLHSGHDSRSEKNYRESNHGRYYNASDQQPSHNRNHGAHRNSKSPEKDGEQHPPQDAVHSESFELDSSAFPALPGAINAVSPTVPIISHSHSDNATVTTSAVNIASSAKVQAASVTIDNSKAINKVPSDSETSNGSTDSVSKLSDIVKNNIPEIASTANFSEIVKGGNKPPASLQTANKPPTSSQNATQTKNSADKPIINASAKNHSAKTQNGPHSHKRPNHLTNGAISSEAMSKSAGKNSNKNVSSVSKQINDVAHVKSPVHSETSSVSSVKKNSSPKKKENSSESPTESAEQKTATEQKVSYAAMAQRVAANSQPAPSKLPSPSIDQTAVSVPNASSGDNNNNSDVNNKTSGSSKNDNLYPSSASKNSQINCTASNSSGPRKPAHGQNTRNSAIFNKKGSSTNRAPPTSPTSRNPAGSHAATASSAVTAR